MQKTLTVLLVAVLAAGVSAANLNIWVGGKFNDGSWDNIMDVAPGGWVDIPVYAMGENAGVFIADMMFPLGINKAYVDQFEPDACRFYHPLAEWDIAVFGNFNDEFQPNHASFSFIGFSRITSFDSPWGHFETPVKIMSFNVHVADNPENLYQEICNALVSGLDPRQGPANAGDTTGDVNFAVNQQFACLYFTPTAIDDEAPIPDDYFLDNSYPNPFNSSAVIKYGLPEPSHVTIEIFDVLGRRIETAVDNDLQAGYYQVNWNAANRATGIYFYRIQAGDFVQTRKMMLLK